MKWLVNLLKRIWTVLRAVIAVAMICLAIWFLWYGFILEACLAFGVALLVDSGTTVAVVGALAEGIGEVAGAVISGLVSGTSSALGSFWGLIAVAAGGYFLLTREGKKEGKEKEKELVGPPEPVKVEGLSYDNG